MPMIWNAEADAKLFAAVLATTDVKLDLPAIAAIMGPECTVKALTHRISNIKKKAAEAAGGGGPVNGAAVTKPATPRKRASPMKKAADSGDGECDESPTKKAKTTGAGKGKKKAAPVKKEEITPVKTEEDEDDGEDTGENGEAGDSGVEV